MRAEIRKRNILLVAIIILSILIIGLSGFILFNINNSATNIQNNTENQTEQENINQTEGFMIGTKYCDLYYPRAWENQVNVRFSNEFGYKVEFYGLVDGKEDKHIFDVCFNSDDGHLLGFLELDKEIINISIDVIELNFDANWTQKEKDQIYSMQEDMNYIIDTLRKNEKYVEPK